MILGKLFTKVIDWTNATATLKTSGNVVLASDSYIYLGDPDTNGTARLSNVDGEFTVHVRVDGVYV